MTRLAAKLNHATIVAYVALFVALGGTAYAANEWTGANIVDASLTGADLKDATVKTVDLGASAVTGGKILDGGVKAVDLGANAVSSAKIADGSVSAADLGNASVGTAEVADGAVAAADLGDNAVNAAKVEDNTLTGTDIADTGSIGSAEVGQLHGDTNIIDNTVSTFDIATNAVDSDEVLDFGLTNQDIGVLFANINADATVANSSGSVTSAKLGTGQYEVDFGRDVSACAFVASIGSATGSVATEGFIQATDRSADANAVFVQAEDQNGANADRPFVLIVVC